MVATKKVIKKEPKAKKPTIVVRAEALMKAIESVRAYNVPMKYPWLEVAVLTLIGVLNGAKIKITKDISTLLDSFDKLKLECDGLTRVLSYKLGELKVKHKIMIGHIEFNGNKVVPVHWWIKLADGRLVDYRARMWAGDVAGVPHGVFEEKDFSLMKYVSGEGQEIEVSRKMYLILTEAGTATPPPAPVAKQAAEPAPVA